jgi:hypothetical protein
MGGIEIQFLVGLYFLVADLPVLFVKPRENRNISRFVAGLVLVILSVMRIAIIS